MKMQTLINHTNIPASLVRAVVRQAGGWDMFRQSASDIVLSGASAGFSGFIYYTDTLAFYARQRKNIITLASNMASDFGEDLLEMIQGLNCIGSEYDLSEIGSTLYGPKSGHDTQIANCLAWFALEEVSRVYMDLMED